MKLPAPTADMGVEPELLPPPLSNDYLVETFYEDDILKLINADPRRFPLLAELGPHWRRAFGPDVRPMFVQHWSLFEPIRAELHLYVQTYLDDSNATAALEQLRRAYLRAVEAADFYIHVVRLVHD